eukprot:jgi/Galph1/3028/GphlegSOOS_G1656.1
MVFSRNAIGILLLILVALLWVSSSVLIQYIFGVINYEKPLFLTYFSTSFFIVYLLPNLVKFMMTKVSNIFLQQQQSGSRGLSQASAVSKVNDLPQETVDEAEIRTLSVQEHTVQNNSFLQVYGSTVIQFGLLWLMANYFFNLALDRTSVASNTILSTLSSIFTLLMASFLQVEKLTLLKVFYVILNFVGVVLVTWSDSRSRGTRTMIGDACSVISALFYSFYVLFLRLRFSESNPVDISQLFGWMGLFMLIGLIPLLFVWDGFQWETFDRPSFTSFLWLVINALIGTVLSDYLWAIAVVFTSPVLATMALSLTIPLSTCFDALGNQTQFSFLYMVGALCVFSGFIGLALENRKDEQVQKQMLI